MPANSASTQNLVAIEGIRENTIVLKDGGLRQVLIVGGINFSLKSGEEQTIITQAYQNFLNSLSFPIQIVIHSRKINIEKYLATLEGRRGEEASGLLQDQIAEYEEFVRGFVRENAIMAKTFFVIVPFAPVIIPGKETFLGFLPFLKKKQGGGERPQKEREGEASFKESLAQLGQRTTQVAEGLSAIGLEVKALTDEELTELLYNFYNPETTEKEKVNMPMSDAANG